jgi:hypothetical protein
LLIAIRSSPSIKILPAVASVNLDIQRRRVDLPEPDKPITTKRSPLLTSKEALLTPTTQPASWNVFASTFPFELSSKFLAFTPKILKTESHLMTGIIYFLIKLFLSLSAILFSKFLA